MPNNPNQHLAPVGDSGTHINQGDSPFVLPTTAESETASTTSAGPSQLVPTNHTQADNENQGIPIVTDAIDRQWKQLYIRPTPGSEYRVDDRSRNTRVVIKDVFIPVNNTEPEIVR